MKHIHIALTALAISFTAHATGTASNDFKDKLTSSVWSWPQTWGNVATRWTEVRFNTDGSFTGWHGARAIYNGTWQQIAPLELKLPGLGASGVRVTFDSDMRRFTATDGSIRIVCTANDSANDTPSQPMPEVSPGAQQSLSFATAGRSSDPVVGRWLWSGNNFVVLSADGKARLSIPGRPGLHGQWKKNENPRTHERTYVVNWAGGRRPETVHLSANHKLIHAQTPVPLQIQHKTHVIARPVVAPRRIVPQVRGNFLPTRPRFPLR